MKKLITLCMASLLLLTACTQKPQSGTASQPQAPSPTQSGVSSMPEEIKMPTSVPRTKTGIEGEDEKYPVEKLDVKLREITNEDIAKYDGTAFSYTPLPALPEIDGGGVRLYQIKFTNGEMEWKYGKVESEFTSSYKGYYVLVQEGVIEAELINDTDPEDIMKITFQILVPNKQDDNNVLIQARMLSCSNNFFDDMSDKLLVYHDKIVLE